MYTPPLYYSARQCDYCQLQHAWCGMPIWPMSDHHVEGGHQLPIGHMCYCQKPWLHHSEAAAPYDVNHRLFVWQKSQQAGVLLQGGVMLHGWHLSPHHCFQLAPQLDNRGWEDNSMCWYSSSQCDNSMSQHGNTTGSAGNRGWEDNSVRQYSSLQCDDSMSQRGNTTGSANYIILWGFCGFLECRQLLPLLCTWKTQNHFHKFTHSHLPVHWPNNTALEAKTMLGKKVIGHQCSTQRLQVIQPQCCHI